MNVPAQRRQSARPLRLTVIVLLCLAVAIGLWELFKGLNLLAALVAAVFVAIAIFNIWASWTGKPVRRGTGSDFKELTVKSRAGDAARRSFGPRR